MSKRIPFSQATIGKKSMGSSKGPKKGMKKIHVGSVGHVGNGVKAAPTKSGGKRIF